MKRLSAKTVLHSLLPLISISILLGVGGCGERRTEKRDEATHVFTGQVKALHEEKVDGVINYRVEVTVESVEKGEGIKPGDNVPVNCYMAMPRLGIPSDKRKSKVLIIGPRPGSYHSVPKENERIKIYARKVNESFNGNYPDWYDVIKAD
jgi:hypothetical protein